MPIGSGLSIPGGPAIVPRDREPGFCCPNGTMHAASFPCPPGPVSELPNLENGLRTLRTRPVLRRRCAHQCERAPPRGLLLLLQQRCCDRCTDHWHRGGPLPCGALLSSRLFRAAAVPGGYVPRRGRRHQPLRLPALPCRLDLLCRSTLRADSLVPHTVILPSWFRCRDALPHWDRRPDRRCDNVSSSRVEAASALCPASSPRPASAPVATTARRARPPPLPLTASAPSASSARLVLRSRSRVPLGR
jgi:hypothetical protein